MKQRLDQSYQEKQAAVCACVWVIKVLKVISIQVTHGEWCQYFTVEERGSCGEKYNLSFTWNQRSQTQSIVSAYTVVLVSAIVGVHAFPSTVSYSKERLAEVNKLRLFL